MCAIYLKDLLDVKSYWVLAHIEMKHRVVEFLIRTRSIETFQTNIDSIFCFLNIYQE